MLFVAPAIVLFPGAGNDRIEFPIQFSIFKAPAESEGTDVFRQQLLGGVEHEGVFVIVDPPRRLGIIIFQNIHRAVVRVVIEIAHQHHISAGQLFPDVLRHQPRRPFPAGVIIEPPTPARLGVMHQAHEFQALSGYGHLQEIAGTGKLKIQFDIREDILLRYNPERRAYCQRQFLYFVGIIDHSNPVFRAKDILQRRPVLDLLKTDNVGIEQL